MCLGNSQQLAVDKIQGKYNIQRQKNKFSQIEIDFKFYVREFRFNIMDNGELINIFKFGSGDQICFLNKLFMRECRNWIRRVKGVEQRELLRDNWKSFGEI